MTLDDLIALRQAYIASGGRLYDDELKGAGMLVVTRCTGESVVITTASGERITVRLAKIRGNQAKLAFEAPASVRINREEVQEQIDGDCI